MKRILLSTLTAALAFGLVALPAGAANKAELIEAIASDSGLSKADAKRALDSFVNNTVSRVKKGDKISLVGFGSFSISKRAARKESSGGAGGGGGSIRLKFEEIDVGSASLTEGGTLRLAFDLPTSFLATRDRLHLQVELPQGTTPRRSDLPLEVIVEPPAGSASTTGSASFEVELPQAAFYEGWELFGGFDALFTYLPVAHADIYEHSILAGDLAEAAEALGMCPDDPFELTGISDRPFAQRDLEVGMQRDTRLSPEEIRAFLDTVLRLGLAEDLPGRRTSAVGFGSFSISKREARKGRNPQTGKEIKIAAKNVVKFKAGADLSKKVN